ncbi:MAG TPA: N-acetylmuramoyl-L-alanine amidase [Alphaproteobacteria bacterium]|nr:N-acetylmuramoyl-L-alanine amidase [Alphaproteobacteria bacterium]
MADGAVGIVGARLGQNGPVTRFVLETTAPPVGAQATAVSGPDRVVIELPSTGWMGAKPPSGTGMGLVTGFHVGAPERGRVRVVLDLSAPGLVRKAFSVPPDANMPNRFVIDVEAAGTQVVAVQAPRTSAPVSATKVGIVPPPPKRPDIRRIVAVDAGHGGVDPGTIGASGTHEKMVTLAMARELKAALEASGRYRVVLTRDDDTFVRLRERVARARAAGAELFISLHADSIGDRGHRGASVYTLSEVASDKEAEALAAKENKADLIGGLDLSNENPEVANILIDLAQRETMNYSARFAVSLVHELDRAAKININPHRYAGFAVLKAPDVPSVLIELGYLSNLQDEKALRDSKQRKRVAAAIVKACDRFFAEKRS